MLKSSRLSFGCLALFLLPFCAVGVGTAVAALRHAAAGEWGDAGFLSIFALTFGGAGFGMLAAGWHGKRALAAREERQRKVPDAPWLWRPDWAKGRIEDTSRATVVMAWALTAFWNLIAFPAGYFALREVVQKGKGIALVALLFPVIGIGLLVWAVRETLRRARFGGSVLRLTTVPGAIGRTIEGSIRVPAAVEPATGFRLTLMSVRRIRRRDNDGDSWDETIEWQDVAERVPGRREGLEALAVPVRFHLPADAAPCDDSGTDAQMVWRLVSEADLPGVNYRATFEVPVFRTAASAEPPPADLVAERDAAIGAYRPPAASPIRVSDVGGLGIHFPAARNRGAAAGLTAFLLTWSGIIAGMIALGAPKFFIGVFGFFAVLILLGVVSLWGKATKVRIGNGAVEVENRWLGVPSRRSFPADEIAAVDVRQGMRSGNTPYYDLMLLRTDGRRTPAGTMIRDRREADWLAGRVREALGHKDL